ncbi:hypothetical protein ACP26L_36555 (plasmid) [Paenibacillus sp. S-38]|uniref:hypothetical protein n=1 Tax=Paenibacillus sp. S-38 TaxID=3416710 RepID=UPI003CF5CCEC
MCERELTNRAQRTMTLLEVNREIMTHARGLEKLYGTTLETFDSIAGRLMATIYADWGLPEDNELAERSDLCELRPEEIIQELVVLSIDAERERKRRQVPFIAAYREPVHVEGRIPPPGE